MAGKPGNTPPPLTGGCGRTDKGLSHCSRKKRRSLPDVALTEPETGYAELLAYGFDSYQEAVNVRIGLGLVIDLEKAQERARQAAEDGSGLAPIIIGAEMMQVRAHGARGGVRFVVANDDFMYLIRSEKTDWGVSVRYLAAGLWEHGLRALQGRAITALVSRSGIVAENFTRLSRADYAFDFYAPAFTPEMHAALADQVVCHSSSKVRSDFGLATHGTSARLQTLTIGSKAGLQVQLYDKGTEITEVSGKTWMKELWGRAGYWPEGDDCPDVWRIEVRFGKAHLRDRNIATTTDLRGELPALLAEALYLRRLTRPVVGDTNRRRWPVHPLWSAAIRAANGGDMVPLGRQVTGRRDAFVDRLGRQLAGLARSYNVAKSGDFDERDIDALPDIVRQVVRDDPHGRAKVSNLQQRYLTLDEAK